MEGGLSFWTTGESLTRLVREQWIDLLPKGALGVLLDGDQISLEIALDVLQGRRKFEGDTRDGDLTIVKDNTQFQQGMALLTPEELSDELEKQFLNVEYSLRCAREEDVLEPDFPISPGIIRSRTEEVRAVLKQLSYIYDLVGKNIIDDLPIDRLKTFSKPPEKKDNIQIEQVTEYATRAAKDAKREEITSEPLWKSEYQSGYIDRQGRFYGCSDFQHRFFADELIKEGLVPGSDEQLDKESDAQIILDNLGWIRMSNGDFYDAIKITNRWSAEQIKTLKEYLRRNSIEHILYNGRRYSAERMVDEITN